MTDRDKLTTRARESGEMMPWKHWGHGHCNLTEMRDGKWYHPARRGIFKRARPLSKMLFRLWAIRRTQKMVNKMSPSNARFARRQMMERIARG